MPTVPLPLAAAGVLFASVCFGLVPLFTKGLTAAGLAPEAIAFYRYVLAGLLLAPLLIRQWRQWRAILWGVASGAVMGLGWIGYALALDAIPVSTVAVLYMTYPVFTLLLAWGLFAERPTARAVSAALVVVAAAALVAGPAAVDRAALPYVLAALAAPFGFGLAISALVHRLTALTAPARIGSASLGAILGLAPLILMAEPTAVWPQQPEHWRLVIGIGLATALVPQLIYVICAPYIGASRTAILGSVELPTMVGVGLLAFGEALGPAQFAACLLILWAIWLSRARGPVQPATRTR